jgi:hypothetical protein
VDGVYTVRVAQLDHDAHDEEEDLHQPHHARDCILCALAEGLKNELQRQAKQGDTQPNEEPEELRLVDSAQRTPAPAGVQGKRARGVGDRSMLFVSP